MIERPCGLTYFFSIEFPNNTIWKRLESIHIYIFVQQWKSDLIQELPEAAHRTTNTAHA